MASPSYQKSETEWRKELEGAGAKSSNTYYAYDYLCVNEVVDVRWVTTSDDPASYELEETRRKVRNRYARAMRKDGWEVSTETVGVFDAVVHELIAVRPRSIRTIEEVLNFIRSYRGYVSPFDQFDVIPGYWYIRAHWAIPDSVSPEENDALTDRHNADRFAVQDALRLEGWDVRLGVTPVKGGRSLYIDLKKAVAKKSDNPFQVRIRP